MTIHVCGGDGQPTGQFEEADFRDKIFAGAFLPDSYYWHEGMEDWKPLSQYRALAKTQRISFTPPVRRTIKISADSPSSPDADVRSLKKRGAVARWINRITGRQNKKN